MMLVKTEISMCIKTVIKYSSGEFKLINTLIDKTSATKERTISFLSLFFRLLLAKIKKVTSNLTVYNALSALCYDVDVVNQVLMYYIND
jgi:hypothetical protein